MMLREKVAVGLGGRILLAFQHQHPPERRCSGRFCGPGLYLCFIISYVFEEPTCFSHRRENDYEGCLVILPSFDSSHVISEFLGVRPERIFGSRSTIKPLSVSSSSTRIFARWFCLRFRIFF